MALRLYSLSWFEEPSSSFQVFSGGSGRGAEREHDEILHVDGQEVVWTAGYGGGIGRVRKSYKQVLHAKQALLSRFVGVGGPWVLDSDEGAVADESGKCLCVLQGLECVKVYAADGAEFEVALPCKAARMWELPRGLLIEREPGVEDVATPMMFSLLHPLEELKPVSYTELETDKSEFICDAKEKILFCSPDLLLVLTYNLRDSKHSLWSLLPLTALEMQQQAAHDIRRDNDIIMNSPGRAADASDNDMDDAATGDNHSQPPALSFGAKADSAGEEDDVIESEIFMQKVWTDAGSKSAADSVFVAHDVQGQVLICLMNNTACTLTALRVKPDPQASALDVSVAFELPVRAAQPVQGSSAGHALDIVVLSKEGELQLWRGDLPLCSLELDEDLCLRSVTRLSCAVSDRVNVHFEDGSILRVATSMTIQSKTLRPCLDALDRALSPQLALSLRVDIALWHNAILYSKEQSRQAVEKVVSVLAGEDGLARMGIDTDLEWIAFIVVIARLIGGESEGRTIVAPPVQVESSEPIDWYARLMRTSFHRDYCDTNNSLAACFNVEMSEETTSALSPESGAWYQYIAQTGIQLKTETAAFRKEFPNLVLSLHLVYEEMKLNTLTWPLLRTLASFLGALAPPAYLDHYRRDLGPIDIVPLPMAALSPQPTVVYQSPPDVYRWLCNRMKSGLGRGSGMTMTPAFPELESCLMTQHICCFFDLLAGGKGDSATAVPHTLLRRESRSSSSCISPVAAMLVTDDNLVNWMHVHGYEARTSWERTVLGMVWCGFRLENLETLPFGISIPLRETLKICRENPSSRWPADAYVLVGREDIAALVLAPPCKGLQESAQPDEQVPATYSLYTKMLQHLDDKAKGMVTTDADVQSDMPQSTPAQTPARPADGASGRVAVTPVWRRMGNPANQMADDLLWHANSKKRGMNSPTSSSKPSRPKAATNTGSEPLAGETIIHGQGGRLLSIADYSSLCASASQRSDGVEAELDDLSQVLSGLGSTAAQKPRAKDSDPSGFELLYRITALRFGKDRRVREVCRLLRSSAPVRLQVERGPEVSDHELVAAQQQKLLQLSKRTMALGVGRGMITLSTVRPLLTDPVEIPLLTLSGRLPANNSTVKLDLSMAEGGTELTAWACFHNGVAAGLRLSSKIETNTTSLTRTWIAYNKPKVPNHAHAGYLLALGLSKHLSALTMADTYEYLAQGHDTTTVAILLGLSAAKRGTMASTISKMLCLHIPSLLPPAFAEMDVAPTVQTTALIGVGLLYEQTANRLMTEFLVAEIGRRPSSDKIDDRESYSLSAGFALGLVTLGYGAKTGGLSGLSDLRLENRLHRYIVGGLDPDAARLNTVDPTKCSRVKEGNYVNVNVTAPGATVALGLIFLKSNNQSVAARLALPETHFLLDYVRPDLLLLRVIARSLVLWDDVQPSAEWVHRQLPSILHKQVGEDAGAADTEDVEMKDSPEDTSQEARMKRRSSSVTSAAQAASKERSRHSLVDEKAIKQARANVVAGACFALGLRFAGTALQSARDVLLDKVRFFAEMRMDEEHPDRPDNNTLEICLGAAAMGVAMVMAGTGDLASFRLLRSLRGKIDGVTYGNHMNIGMAIGLLFLGAGRFTLRNDNSAIALMLLSFYPRVPFTSLDNRYHNQAFRHLYVLATEERCMDGFEVDEGVPCYVPIKVRLKANALQIYGGKTSHGVTQHNRTQSTTIMMITPCLLPPLSWIQSIQVCSSRYMDICVDQPSELASLLAYKVLCVKRKVGHLSYGNDHRGVSSLLARPKRTSDKSVILKDFPELLAFAQNFCVQGVGSSSEEKEFTDFCRTVLYDCLAEEKPELIYTFIELYQATRSMPHDTNSPLHARNFSLISTFYDRRLPLQDTASKPLIPPSFLASIQARLEASFDDSELAAYARTNQVGSKPLACMLNYAEIPELQFIQRFFPNGSPKVRLPVLAIHERGKHSAKALLKLYSATKRNM